MTGETRIPQRLGTRGSLKTSKPLESSVLARAPLKRHSPVPKLKSAKGTVAKSPSSSSSSDSSSAKRCLNRGKAMANREISQGTAKDAATVLSSESAVETTGTALIREGTQDTPAAPTLSTSEGTAETKTGTEFESLSELSFEFVDPDETKRVITDEATAPRNAAPSINNGEFGGAIGGVCSTNEPLQQENCEDGEIVLEELLDTEDLSEGKDDSLDGSTVPKKSEAKGVVKQAFDSLMREAGPGIAPAWSGWRSIRFLLPASVLVLFTVLFCVENWILDELDMLPPPT